MAQQALPQGLDLFLRLGLTPVSLKPRPKQPLVRWANGCNPSTRELEHWASQPGLNWGVRCGPEPADLDFDTMEASHSFLQDHPEAISWPRVKTGSGYHIWLKPKRSAKSQSVDATEIKCLSSYVLAPPSINPGGTHCIFLVALYGTLPAVDIEARFGLPIGNGAPRSSSPDASASLCAAAITHIPAVVWDRMANGLLFKWAPSCSIVRSNALQMVFK